MRRVVLCLIVLLAYYSFAATPEEQIMKADRDFHRATQAKRAEGWDAYFAENAAVPATPPLAGKQAISEHFQKVFADPNFTLTWDPLKAEVFSGGKMGYTTGKYVARFKDEKSGKMMEQTGQYITVWKKQDDGSWKIVADTGSEDRPTRLAQ